MFDIKTLRDEFASVHAEASKVIDTAVTEKRDLSAEEQTANAARFARLEQIKKAVDDSTRLAGLAFARNDPAISTANMGNSTGNFTPGADVPFTFANDGERAEFNRATSDWFRSGNMSQKFATITTATQSGILLPSSVMTPLIGTAPNSFRDAYASYGLPVVQTVNTATFKVPVMDAAAGGVVSETASSENENPPSLSESIVSTVKTYESGSAWFSNQDLSAVDFDLIQATLPALYYSKELGLESAITAAIIADSGVASLTTASPTAFTYTELATLNRKLPKRYDRLKVMLLSGAAFTAAESMVDTTGRPILTPDAQGSSLRFFNGTPVIRNDYLGAVAATNVTGILFSLFGFHLRDAAQPSLVRFVNFPARGSQTGANLYSYHAYGYAPSAVYKLKQHA